VSRPGWIASGTATATTAMATKTAESGKQFTISGVDASFSAAAIALLVVKEDSTVKWSGYVHNQRAVDLNIGLSVGSEASAELSSGGVGIVGYVNLKGNTF